MNTFLKNALFITLGILSPLLLLTSCGDDDGPEEENVEEIITDVTLTFTPTNGGSTVTAIATDPDGEGAQDIQVSGPINLAAETSYTLKVTIENKIENEDITVEVAEEADEHLLLYSWTSDLFSSPVGNGNIDNRTDALNYEDKDDNGLPLGLETAWSTAGVESGTFRVVLKHQPDIKSATSGINDGESDFDISWTINIQ